MGIARFDDGIPQQEKFRAAGPVACWLWFCSICHARKGLTDGFIPKAVVPTLIIGLSTPYKHAERLVTVGLWNHVVGGYEVNDYHDYNPHKEEVLELRKRDRDRKRIRPGIQDGFRPDGATRIPDDGSSHTRAGGKSGSRSRSDLDLASSSEESARETIDELEPLSEIPPKWGHPRRRHSLDASVDYHRRNCPPWAAAACEGGICIPKYLWQQWDKRQPPNTLEAFVVAVMHESPPAGDDGERFWPAHFQRAFGTTAPSSSTKPRTAAEKTLDTLRRA